MTKKSDPLVHEVELIHANPTYAHIKFPDGRESTASLKDLAKCPREEEPAAQEPELSYIEIPDEISSKAPSPMMDQSSMTQESEENLEQFSPGPEAPGQDSLRENAFMRRSPRNRRSP